MHNLHYITRAKSEKGLSTLEVLVAFMIMTLTLTAVTLVTASNQTTSISSQTSDEAIAKAQEQLEQARALSRQDLSLVKNCDDTSATKCSGTVDPYYNRKITVTDIDSFSKNVVSQVTWMQGAIGLQRTVTLSTIVADWSSAVGGDTCSPTLTGDWAHPQLLGSADVGQNNGGTNVDVFANKAYVTADPSANGKPNFYVIDVSSPNISLPILGSLDTNPTSGVGLAAVRVAGKYAYVANMSATSQLQVIDISTPSVPVLVKSFDVTSAGDAAVGNSIFYASKKIYLGLTKSDGPEFYVIDVSDPLNPSVKGSFEAGTAVNAITIKNNVAYIATPWPSSNPPTKENLSVLDISNPSAGINRINTFTSPDPSTMSGQSVYISKDGNTLYFGRGGLNSANNPEFFSLDVTNPSASPLPVLGSKYIPTSNDITVNAIAVRSNLAFLWTNDTNLGFQIWDLNNLSSPTPYGSVNTQQTATGGMDCDGNIIYVAQKSNKALQIIGPATDLYALSNDGNIVVIQGASGSNTITRTLVSGIPPADTLTIAGLPAGVTATFSNNPCTATCSSQLTINTLSTTPAGTYPIVVSGAGGASTTFNLRVNSSFSYTISTPANVSLVRAGVSRTTSFNTTLVTGATQPVSFTNSSLPNGVVMNYSITTCSPTCTVTLTLSASATATLGSSPITISGNPLSNTPSFTVTVTAPAFNYSLANTGNVVVTRGSPSVDNTITATMTVVGAVPQSISLSNSSLPTGVIVSYSPVSGACTPNTSSPYQCTVVLSFSAPLSAPSTGGGSGPTITITGVSSGGITKTTTFKLKVQ